MTANASAEFVYNTTYQAYILESRPSATAGSADISFDLVDLNHAGVYSGGAASVRDLFSRQDLGSVKAGEFFTLPVPFHGVRMSSSAEHC